jgi:hypothetical protein
MKQEDVNKRDIEHAALLQREEMVIGDSQNVLSFPVHEKTRASIC